MASDIEQPYKFPDRPAAKSSTEVGAGAHGMIVCPSCGCRSIGTPIPGSPLHAIKKGCKCVCHEERE